VKVLDLRIAASSARSARDDRPATAIVHESPDVRLVVFRIAPGQQVPPHRSTSTVLLTALEGSGFFVHADGEIAASTGVCVACEPNELHGMRAANEPLVVLATITPRPGARTIPT
jgi:quercetin dioxygenase-like cupin family protein